MDTLDCSLAALLQASIRCWENKNCYLPRMLRLDLLLNVLSLRLFVVAMTSFSVIILRACVPSETHKNRLQVIKTGNKISTSFS